MGGFGVHNVGMTMTLVTVVFLLVALVVALVILAVVALPNLRGDRDGDPAAYFQASAERRSAARHSSRTSRTDVSGRSETADS